MIASELFFKWGSERGELPDRREQLRRYSQSPFPPSPCLILGVSQKLVPSSKPSYSPFAGHLGL